MGNTDCSSPLCTQLAECFGERLQRDLTEAVVVRSPGRLNLLGEHTDYNGGFVLPIAIDRATWVVAAPAEGRVRVWAEAMGEGDEFDPYNIETDVPQLWARYVRGVLKALGEQSIHVGGADVLITGDLPLGAGVSSSASLETGCGLAFTALAGAHIAPRDMALLCQHVENAYVGVNCGIMDQFAVGLCEPDSALLLDCRSLETQSVALGAGTPVFFVCDTNKPRELAASAYNQRRAECEGAARHFGQESLRDVTLAEVERDKDILGDVVYRRCRHVLTENQRVLDSIAIMGRGDWAAFGNLLKGSHASLRDDYEVSCEELDIMCELAQEAAGCLGARMVGAGFGGCAMAAVEADAGEGFGETLAKKYQAATGREPRIFAVKAAPGAAIERKPE